MKRARTILWGVAALVLAVFLPACEDDDEIINEPEDNPPEIQLTAPNGGEAVQPGSDLEITWTATDDNEVVGVDLSYNSGGGQQVIATGLTGSSYTWAVPDANVFSVTVIAVATDNAGQTAQDESDAYFGIIEHSARGYVGSETCRNCHLSYYNEILASGHTHILNKVNGGPPSYPNSTVPDPPAGLTWDDIAYVVGGSGWKARFVTADSGWVMTDGMDGVNTQYNVPRSDLGGGLPAEWVSYNATDTERKPYDCGGCHTTGWQDLTENGGVHQDGLIGIEGTWEEIGVRCEACHGAGANHVASQSASDITVDGSSAACGTCHVRGDPQIIPASAGYIRHQQQYNEILASPHGGSVECGDCHEPHILTRYGNAAAGGIVQTCEDCHTVTLNHLPIDCESCHMARASRSAREVHSFEADLRTHIFRINPDGNLTKSDMLINGGTEAEDFVTLDFACYSCHTDPLTLEGGGRSQKTMAELANKAAAIHP